MTVVIGVDLPSGHRALVDEADAALIDGYKWRALIQPKNVYVHAHVGYWRDNKDIRLHRLITGAAPDQVVDHVNHDGLDNRRSNLRVCTRSFNNGNARRAINNTSGYKGVCWLKARKCWVAYIWRNNKRVHLGTFGDPWEAAQAYNIAAHGYWGEFALINSRIEVA